MAIKYNIGDIIMLKNKQSATIIDRFSTKDKKSPIKIKFNDSFGYECFTTASELKSGNIINPFVPSVLGIGYMGCKNLGNKKIYYTWKAMLYRCYDEKYLNKFPTYRDVKVCDEWLCFKIFYDWYIDTYPFDIPNLVFEIDKDLKQLGSKNKIYSPKTCLWLPKKINYLIISNVKNLGVSYVKSRNKWLSQCKNFNSNKTVNLGRFTNKTDAINTYIEYKKNQIQTAKEYMRSFNIYNDSDINLLDKYIETISR